MPDTGDALVGGGVVNDGGIRLIERGVFGDLSACIDLGRARIGIDTPHAATPITIENRMEFKKCD